MPTYEYLCEKCGHGFDVFQPISAQPLQVCPKNLCGRKTWGRGRVKRKICAGAGLLFKGSGFYITDHRSRNYKEAVKKESAPAPGTGKTAAPASPPAKAPAKPEAK